MTSWYIRKMSDHINRLRMGLQVLKENQLFTKYSNCEFWFRLLVFLSHIICSEGVEVDTRKTEAVKTCPRPLPPTNIKSFLGLAGYYLRFVDGFTSIASPLTTLTQKSERLVGGM